MTSTIPTDAPSQVVCAYRWLHAGQEAMAEVHLRELTREEIGEARTTLLRLAVLVESMVLEHDVAMVAKACLTPDALPDGVDGFAIGGGPARDGRPS